MCGAHISVVLASRGRGDAGFLLAASGLLCRCDPRNDGGGKGALFPNVKKWNEHFFLRAEGLFWKSSEFGPMKLVCAARDSGAPHER
jgi:hypothetical protein